MTLMLQACTELVQAIMSKLGGLLTPSTLSYLLSIICWLGALTQVKLSFCPETFHKQCNAGSN